MKLEQAGGLLSVVNISHNEDPLFDPSKSLPAASEDEGDHDARDPGS